MMKRIIVALVIGIGLVVLVVAALLNPSTKSTSYTKSRNCSGPSVMTLRFAPEPTARMFPEAIWFEECPNEKYYMRIGDRLWEEITKRQADSGRWHVEAGGTVGRQNRGLNGCSISKW